MYIYYEKVLSILSAFVLTATTATTVIACGDQNTSFNIADLSTYTSEQKAKISNLIADTLVWQVRNNTTNQTIGDEQTFIKQEFQIALNKLLETQTPVGLSGIATYVQTSISESDLKKPLSANETFTLNVSAINKDEIFNPIKGKLSVNITLRGRINLADWPEFIFIQKPAKAMPKEGYSGATLEAQMQTQIQDLWNIDSSAAMGDLAKIKFNNGPYKTGILYEKGSVILSPADIPAPFVSGSWQPAFVVGNVANSKNLGTLSFATSGDPAKFPKSKLLALITNPTIGLETKVNNFLNTKLDITGAEKLTLLKDYTFDFNQILNYFSKIDTKSATVDLTKITNLTIFILKNSKLIWNFDPVFNLKIEWT